MCPVRAGGPLTGDGWERILVVHQTGRTDALGSGALQPLEGCQFP